MVVRTAGTAKNEKIEKAEETRRRILDAAARLFRKSGYAGVSLRMIAASARMKAGSVYYHFKSKDEIVTDILNIGIERVHGEVENAIAGLAPSASAEQLILHGVRAHLKALHDHSSYTSANVRIYGQLPKKAQQKNLKVRADYEALWDRILVRAQALNANESNVDVRIFRLMLIGCLNATLEWFDPKKGSILDLADHYAGYLLNGFQGQGS